VFKRIGNKTQRPETRLVTKAVFRPTVHLCLQVRNHSVILRQRPAVASFEVAAMVRPFPIKRGAG
jgi:hypothetical protein